MARKQDETGLASALKEQLALIAFIILFAGMVSTETYYAAFGIRYQLLELSVAHLVSRGLTAVLDGPFLLIAYLAAIAWLSAGAAWLPKWKPQFSALVQPVTYALVLGIVVIAYFASVGAGRAAAMRDLGGATSRLPVIQGITTAAGKPLPYAGYRLLSAGKDTVALFRPVSSPAESPFIHLLKRDDVGEITITR